MENFDYRSILVDSGSIVQCMYGYCVRRLQVLRNQRAVATACRATEGKQTSQAVGAVPDIFIDSVSCTLGFTS